MSDTERQGKPSASSMYRYKACPGSWRLSQSCEDFKTREMMEWAESGDRVHAVLAGQRLSDDNLATDEEMEIVAQCQQQVDALIDKRLTVAVEKWFEKRLWLTVNRKKLLSGKGDLVALSSVSASLGLVVDYKSNRGEQDPADENYQIRTLIVLASEQWPQVETWYGAIIQPLVTDTPTVVKYERSDVVLAKAELLEILAAIEKEDAATNAGVHCKFCPAVLRCQSARAMFQALGLVEPDDADGKALGEYLVLCKSVEPIIKRIRARAKSILALDPSGVPGWTLGKPSSTRTITDAFAAFQALVEAKLIDRDTFLKECISVGIGKAEKAVQKFTGKKAGEAKTELSAVLVNAGVIEFEKKEPSLEQV